MTWTEDGRAVAYAVINPGDEPFAPALEDGNRNVLFGSAENGEVPGRSVTVFGK